MAAHAIEVSDVWKKFRRGEVHDSLRDLVPAIARRIFRKSPDSTELNRNSFWALKNVGFHLDSGEALGIIGPNGAGKSTMLKILSRILRPNRGRVRVNGRLSALIEVSAGFHSDLTGRENIYLNGSILGMKKREIDAKLEEIVAFSGVGSFIDTPVKRYSSGMHARLGFSVAAHLAPDILLVDEVLSVGDVQFQNKCVANMKDKIKNGATVIFVSHNLPAVVDLCPKAMLLHLGEAVFWGDSKEAAGRYMNLVSDVSVTTGDGAVEITHSSWNGSSNDTLRPGDDFEFQVGLLFRQPVSCPTFSLVVKRVTDNLPLYDVAAQELGLEPRNYLSGEQITISFKGKINLLRGLYSAGFNVYLPSRAQHLLIIPSLYQFYVQENASFEGIADLACRVSERSTRPQSTLLSLS